MNWHTSPVPGRPPTRMRSSRAFSLVEVMLAMGVVAFSIITAIGVIPAGLVTIRQAMNDTVESQIVQRMGAQVAATPYAQLQASLAGKTFYFDDQGAPLTNGLSASPSRPARYSATATLATPAFPGSTGVSASGYTNSLWTVRVRMTTLPANATTNTYSIQAPNTGL